MSSLRDFYGSARLELPAEAAARWASLFFSLSVLTYLISLAASQAFLSVAGAIYAAHVFRNQPLIRFPAIKLPLALFCLASILSVFFAPSPLAGLFVVRKLVLFVIMLLTVNLVTRRRHLEFLYQGLFIESALAGVVGAVQFVVQYRHVRALQPGRIYFYLTSARIHGFMGHWMNFGGQQMLVFSCLVAFLVFARPRQKVWWVAVVIVAASIVLNLTRGVWLGCLAALITLVTFWRARWLGALPVLALAAFLAAPGLVRQRVEIVFHPTRDPSLAIRFEMWQVALRMIEKHPWVGVGPNNIDREYALYLPPGKPAIAGYHSHFHNNFFQFGAERGLPCLAAWVWFMVALGWHFVKIRRRLRNAGRNAWAVTGVLAAWLAFLVEGCFEFNFGTSPVLMVFLFLVSTPFVVEWTEGQAPAMSGR